MKKSGVLITLRPLRVEGVVFDRSPGIGNGARAAYHGQESCEAGQPCVRFVSSRVLESGRRWKVTLSNVVAVIRHEEIHHVLIRIGELKANEQFDDLHRDYYDVCQILNCNNHQVSS